MRCCGRIWTRRVSSGTRRRGSSCVWWMSIRPLRCRIRWFAPMSLAAGARSGYADRAYDHDKYRKQLRRLTITPVIARRGEEHGSGLGVHRWVVEQTFALLHWFPPPADPLGDSRRHSRSLPQPRLLDYLLAPTPQPLIELGVLGVFGFRPRRLGTPTRRGGGFCVLRRRACWRATSSTSTARSL